MHQRLKERLVGAAVLVVIAVIFIPMLLTGPIDSTSITKTNIPDRPTEKFNSKLVPLTDSLKPIKEVDDISSDREEVIDYQQMNKNTPVQNQTNKGDLQVTQEKNETTADIKKPVQEKVIKDKQVGLTAWVVQLGSFASKVNADKLNLNLRKSGFPAFVEPLAKNGKTSYRVRVGPEILRADADALLKKIKTKMKLDGIVLNYP